MTVTRISNLELDVNHVTRVEGHGNIVVRIIGGVLEHCQFQIVEAPRYFEAMLRGRPFGEASHIASRICGICAVAHATTSLLAVEGSLGLEPDRQTVSLRKLNFLGEILDSHILHVYMLVAPDLLGVSSVVSLRKSDPGLVKQVLRMKKTAGDICATICGRHTHPIAMTTGGFTHLPSESDLLSLKDQLAEIRPYIDATVELFQGVGFPDFERETEYIALTKDDEYCFIDGVLTSTDGIKIPATRYQEVINETQVSHSTAKHASSSRDAYMVGALARFNLSYDRLHPAAKQAATTFNLTPKCTNPFMITLAQVVEIVHCYETAILEIEDLLNKGLANIDLPIPHRISGEGVGACEAPRGTLLHHYAIKNGFITDANCIIPTAQNLANIELDMRAYIPKILDRTHGEITRSLELLIRSYDPCISCSTHLVEVKFG